MQKLRLHSFGMLLGVLMTFPVGAMCDDNYNKQQRDLQNDQHAGASGNMGDQNDQRRYRMKSNSGQSALDQEEQQDVRQMLGSLIESAVAGDAEDVVDYLVENDRDRMQNERLADRDQLEQASETFREKWEARNNSSFEDSFDQSALNVHFTDGASDNTTNITVSDGSDSVMLKVVNEGTLMDDWQIDAPNSLTKKELRRKISEALQGDQSNANTNKMAIQLLKPLGTSNMKG